MKKRIETTHVKDGWIKRDAKSGRFVEVGTGKSAARESAKTRAVVREASSKRRHALKRLADR